MAEWLKGKKTYFVAALAIATTGIGWYYDGLSAAEAIVAVLTAIGGSTIRSAIANK